MVRYLKTSVGELAASKDWKYFIHGMGWVMADQKQTNYISSALTILLKFIHMMLHSLLKNPIFIKKSKRQ